MTLRELQARWIIAQLWMRHMRQVARAMHQAIEAFQREMGMRWFPIGRAPRHLKQHRMPVVMITMDRAVVTDDVYDWIANNAPVVRGTSR